LLTQKPHGEAVEASKPEVAEHDPQPDVMMVEEPEDVQLQSEPTSTEAPQDPTAPDPSMEQVTTCCCFLVDLIFFLCASFCFTDAIKQ